MKIDEEISRGEINEYERAEGSAVCNCRLGAVWLQHEARLRILSMRKKKITQRY